MNNAKRYWLSTEGMREARGAPGDIQGAWVRAEDYDEATAYAVTVAEAAKLAAEWFCYEDGDPSLDSIIAKHEAFREGRGYHPDYMKAIYALRDALAKNPNDQAGSAKAAGAPGAELTAAPTNTEFQMSASQPPEPEDHEQARCGWNAAEEGVCYECGFRGSREPGYVPPCPREPQGENDHG